MEELCELIKEIYGACSEECGEVYPYYSKALLEVTRLQTGVQSQASEGVDLEKVEKMDDSTVWDPEKLRKDERLEEEEKVAKALEQNYEKNNQAAKLHNAEDSDDSVRKESSSKT